MKVSKDQHLKAERKCLSAAAAEWSVTRDQTPGTIWGYHTSTFFLKILANMYRERKTWSSRKFGERNFFLAKMTFSRWKNLEQPSYDKNVLKDIVIVDYFYICIYADIIMLHILYYTYNEWYPLLPCPWKIPCPKGMQIRIKSHQLDPVGHPKRPRRWNARNASWRCEIRRWRLEHIRWRCPGL